MSATSTAPEFKATLMTSLKARHALDGVQVQPTYPGGTLRPQALYYGHTRATVDTPIIAGPRMRRGELYEIEVMIDVCDGSNDVSKAETLAFSIMGELDDALATDPTQGNAGGSSQNVIVGHILDWESRPYMDESRQGWAVLLRVNVQVKARLR